MFPSTRNILLVRLGVLVALGFLLLCTLIGLTGSFYLALASVTSAPVAALLTAVAAGAAAALLAAIAFCRPPKPGTMRHRVLPGSVSEGISRDLERLARKHPRDFAAAALVAGLVVGASPRTRMLLAGLLDRTLRTL